MNLKTRSLLLIIPVLLSWHTDRRHVVNSRIYAVVIGVAGYKDQSIPSLKFPEKDATDFYNLLRSPICGSVPEENIALLVGPKATRGNVIKEMISKFSRATPDDMIIFYFSGHGVGGEFENNGYLLSYDAESDNEGATSLSMDEIKSKIDRSQAKMKVSYVDACHAGLFPSTGKGTTADENAAITKAFTESLSLSGDGNVSFLASSARQQSIEDNKLGHGVFTYYLINGLKGEADKVQKGGGGNGNAMVSIGELSAYLTDKIQSGTNFKQRPSIVGLYDDSFPLSILNPNVDIKDEISKRPIRKIKIANSAAMDAAAAPASPKYDLSDKKFSPDNTFAYGYYNIINGFNEPIMIYTIQNTCTDCAMLIAPGKRLKTPRLVTGTYFKDDGRISNANSDYTLYFRTMDESKPIKYGSLILPVDAFVEKSLVVSSDNLYLSEKNRKF